MASWVILIGAGASFGAGGIAPGAPPLGAKLYQALRVAFPRTWGNLPKFLEDAFGPNGTDFEAGMSALIESAGMQATQMQRELGHLLTRYNISQPSICLFVRLATYLGRALGSRSIMVSSLNYDMLIEEALSIAGVPFRYCDQIQHASTIAVNKPHGSGNFLPVGGVVAMPGVYMNAQAVTTNPTIEALPRSQALSYYAGSNQIPPCMSFFMPGKASMTRHWITEAMQKGLRDAVLGAEVVITVGVRPLPEDHHIWNPIRDTQAEVLLCCAEAEYQDWRSGFRSAMPTKFLGSTFDQALPNIVAHLERVGPT